MKLSDQQYAQALYETLAEAKPGDYDTVISNFISVLKRTGHLNRYPSIIEAYERYDKEARGVTEATVTLAHETKVSGTVIDALNTLAQKDVKVKTQIDENIIGGVVIRMDDTLIDASVKNSLSQLKKDLST